MIGYRLQHGPRKKHNILCNVYYVLRSIKVFTYTLMQLALAPDYYTRGGGVVSGPNARFYVTYEYKHILIVYYDYVLTGETISKRVQEDN